MHTPLDSLSFIVYAAVFVCVALLTLRRPAYGLCALILVQPFAYYHDVFSTMITLPKATLLAVLLGLLGYRYAFAPLAYGAPRHILFAGIIVMIATLASYAQASYHDLAMRESLKALEYVLLFSVVVAAYRLDPDRRVIANAFFAAGIIVSVLALAQEVTGAPSGMWVNGHVMPRIAGPLEGPNQLAAYLEIALPVALAFALEEPSALAYAALLVIGCTDVLTFSRAGMFGALAAIAVVLFVYRRNVRVPVLFLGAGVVVGAVVAAAWSMVVHSGMTSVFRFSTFQESSYGGGVGTRSELWHAAITLWKQHPLLGIGAGNFEMEIPRTGLQGVKTHANSLYLQSLVEGGIPLLAATLWLTYTSIATFARERLESPFVLGAFAASIALALHQVVDFLTFYPKVGGTWWILLGVGAAELAVRARVRAAACA